MTVSSKFISALVGIFISSVSFVQPNNSVVEYLSVPGPITINNYTYNLSWSSHPSADYYKQEYIGAKDNADKYNKMVLIEVLLGEAKPADLANAKVNELKQLKQTNPIVNYEIFQKNGEMILDFLLSQNSPDGKKIIILERNVYRYKAVTDKNGKKGIMLFGASERSYGSAADAFLVDLKKNKSVLTNAVAAFNIPEISIKK